MRIQTERIQQIETNMIKAIKEQNCNKLFNTVKPKTFKAFMAIKLYFSELQYNTDRRWKKYQPANAKISTLRNTNILDLTYEMLIEYKGAYDLADAVKAKYAAKQELKKLQAQNVLFHLSADRYMVNPLFIYVGDKWDDCYFEWCTTTGEEYSSELADDTRRRWDVKGHRMVQAASRAMIKIAIENKWIEEAEYDEGYELPDDILEKVKAIQNTPAPTFDRAQPIEPQSKLTGFLDYYFSNTNHPEADYYSKHKESYMEQHKEELITECKARLSQATNNYQVSELQKKLAELMPSELPF